MSKQHISQHVSKLFPLPVGVLRSLVVKTSDNVLVLKQSMPWVLFTYYSFTEKSFNCKDAWKTGFPSKALVWDEYYNKLVCLPTLWNGCTAATGVWVVIVIWSTHGRHLYCSVRLNTSGAHPKSGAFTEANTFRCCSKLKSDSWKWIPAKPARLPAGPTWAPMERMGPWVHI